MQVTVCPLCAETATRFYFGEFGEMKLKDEMKLGGEIQLWTCEEFKHVRSFITLHAYNYRIKI